MLYANFHIPIAHRQTPEGNFNGAVIGQFQTGACRFYLEAPRKVGRFIKGERSDLSISHDLSRPDYHIWRVSKTATGGSYLILSSRRPDGRDFGTGYIMAPAEQPVKLIDYAHSGRLTHAAWQVALLEVSPGDVFVVRIHANQETTHACYIVGDKRIIEVSKDELIESYEAQHSQLERAQRRHTAVDLRGYWSGVIHPHTGNCRLF